MRFATLVFFGISAFAATGTQVLPQPPVRFEPHPGHGDQAGAIRWSSRGLGYSLAFTSEATVFQFGERALTMRLLGADPNARFEAAAPYSVPTQYFTAAYRGPVQSYQRLRRHQVYPGVDVVFYGSGGNLEYDFEIAAGADPSLIRLRFDGADRLRMVLNGDLSIELGGEAITQRVPVVYQVTASGDRKAVHAEYRIEANRDVTVHLDSYDRAAPLVIDPVISFAAYLSGSNSDTGVAIGHDAQGFVYIAGNTASADFPANTNAYFGLNRGTQNAWLMKLNPSAPGNEVIVYATYYGGSAVDSLKAMAVSADGVVYLTGSTTSTDLLTTGSALQAANAGATDGFVAVFDTKQSGTASLLYGTYLGGAGVDEPSGIATFNGKAYVTGSTLSDNFPVANAVFTSRAGGRDIFISELDPSKSGAASLVASHYFGGSGTDYGRSIAVDALGRVYVSGITFSRDLPITANPYQAVSSGSGDAFVVEFELTLPLILYSSYLGGSGTDDAKKILIDPAGRIALAGYTSSANFPITQNAFQPFLGAADATNAFLTILDLTVPGSQAVVYSTFFGGSVAEAAYDLRRDASGKYYLGGYSVSPNLPVSQNALNSVSAKDGINGFIAIIDPGAPPLNSLIYSSYVTGPGSQIVYGVDFAVSGNIYATGYATSDIFPAGYQSHTSGPGNSDAFLLGFKLDAAP